MEEAALQHELRQIRCRRIEIRGTKAALDMEDLHLDGRQTTIEQILRARMLANPRFVGHQRVPQNNVVLLGPQAHQRTPRSEMSHDTPTINQRNAVKSEPHKKLDEKTVISIDDDDDDDDSHDDNATTKKKRPPQRSKPGLNTANARNKVSSDGAKPKSIPSKPQQEKSKIVVLKVRYDPNQPRRVHNLQRTALKQPTQQTPTTQYLHRPPEQLDKPGLQDSPARIHPSRSVPSKPRSNNSATAPDRKTPATFSPQQTSSSTTSTQTQNHNTDQQCPCLNRDRNCRICRGTPAVIAEGRRQQRQKQQHIPTSTTTNTTSNNTLASSSPSRPVRQAATTQPKTYHIPTYEDMTSTHRADLELRYCRRIVAALWSIRNNPSLSPSSKSKPKPKSSASVSTAASAPPPSPPLGWTHRLTHRNDLWDFLLSELSNLLKRRPVARENGEGEWDGSVLVSRAADLGEFVDGVRDVLLRATCGHPVGCCVLDEGEGDGDGDDGEGEGGKFKDCWAREFWEWFDVQVGRCRDCMSACVVALEGVERRGLVDEWVVG